MRFLVSLLTILALLVAGDVRGVIYVNSYRFATAQTFLVNQNFEGAGYDNGESWTENGTPDPNCEPLRTVPV